MKKGTGFLAGIAAAFHGVKIAKPKPIDEPSKEKIGAILNKKSSERDRKANKIEGTGNTVWYPEDTLCLDGNNNVYCYVTKENDCVWFLIKGGYTSDTDGPYIYSDTSA